MFFVHGKPLPLVGVNCDNNSGVALLALGFTYDSRFAVEAWVCRFRKDFGDKPQVTFYEVPMMAAWAALESGSSITECGKVPRSRITRT